jgi:hypothetical protein
VNTRGQVGQRCGLRSIAVVNDRFHTCASAPARFSQTPPRHRRRPLITATVHFAPHTAHPPLLAQQQQLLLLLSPAPAHTAHRLCRLSPPASATRRASLSIRTTCAAFGSSRDPKPVQRQAAKPQSGDAQLLQQPCCQPPTTAASVRPRAQLCLCLCAAVMASSRRPGQCDGRSKGVQTEYDCTAVQLYSRCRDGRADASS